MTRASALSCRLDFFCSFLGSAYVILFEAEGCVSSFEVGTDGPRESINVFGS